jgi:hypothetical protein
VPVPQLKLALVPNPAVAPLKSAVNVVCARIVKVAR